MMRRLIAVTLLALVPVFAHAQDEKRPAPQQGTAPNYGTREGAGTGPGGQEIRPGNRDGDAPSASAGEITRTPVQRRIFGMPLPAVLMISAMLVGLLALAAFVLPNTRRRSRARGTGTFGER